MNTAKLTTTLGAALIFLSCAAHAEIQIQSAQYKENKDALFVKGKTSDKSVSSVYVVNAETNQLIGSIDARKGDFRSDITVNTFSAPCMIQVQTNRPGNGWFGGNNNPGDFQIASVRNPPASCAH